MASALVSTLPSSARLAPDSSLPSKRVTISPPMVAVAEVAPTATPPATAIPPASAIAFSLARERSCTAPPALRTDPDPTPVSIIGFDDRVRDRTLSPHEPST
ncbi:MAG: hypothetical protein MZV64_15785 [Ignavibacteriales bacterium]|nr:hypothetical protein [Ignavibacteriales bacterium]